MANRILLADNDQRFLKGRKRQLEAEGYEVIPAVTVNEALRILERGGVDMAILDVRLIDDGSAQDVSGLRVAEKSDHSIPKILLTSFPTIEMVRDALGPSKESGRPPAVDFVEKKESPALFLARVRRVMERRKAEKQLTTFTRMEGVVGDLRRLIANPSLHNYRGFFCVSMKGLNGGVSISDAEGLLRVAQGAQCVLSAWLQPNEPGAAMGGPIDISDGEDAPEVAFEVAIENTAVEFQLNRGAISVRPGQPSEHLSFPFTAPAAAGEHEVWVKVFQKHRLIQIMKGMVQVEEKGG